MTNSTEKLLSREAGIPATFRDTTPKLSEVFREAVVLPTAMFLSRPLFKGSLNFRELHWHIDALTHSRGWVAKERSSSNSLASSFASSSEPSSTSHGTPVRAPCHQFIFNVCSSSFSSAMTASRAMSAAWTVSLLQRRATIVPHGEPESFSRSSFHQQPSFPEAQSHSGGRLAVSRRLDRLFMCSTASSAAWISLITSSVSFFIGFWSAGPFNTTSRKVRCVSLA